MPRSRGAAGPVVLSLALLAACGSDGSAPTSGGSEGPASGGTAPSASSPKESPKEGDPAPLDPRRLVPVSASATVEVGGHTYEFPASNGPLRSSCALHGSGDVVSVTADFNLADDRWSADNFSLAARRSEGDTNWGLYIRESEEEWSGSGPVTLEAIHEDVPEGEEAFLGTRVVVRWQGTATENLSSEQRPASVVVDCWFDPT